MHRDTATDRSVRTTDAGARDDGRGDPDDGERPARRATHLLHLLKLAATTLAALVGVARALGLL